VWRRANKRSVLVEPLTVVLPGGNMHNERLQQTVNEDYGRRDLLRAIKDALRDAGKDPERPTTSDLAPLDHFHTRGKEATLGLLQFADLPVVARSSTLTSGASLRTTNPAFLLVNLAGEPSPPTILQSCVGRPRDNFRNEESGQLDRPVGTTAYVR
jgi:hypothetical protein